MVLLRDGISPGSGSQLQNLALTNDQGRSALTSNPLIQLGLFHQRNAVFPRQHYDLTIEEAESDVTPHTSRVPSSEMSCNPLSIPNLRPGELVAKKIAAARESSSSSTPSPGPLASILMQELSKVGASQATLDRLEKSKQNAALLFKTGLLNRARQVSQENEISTQPPSSTAASEERKCESPTLSDYDMP
jgi:hypothetical protein